MSGPERQPTQVFAELADRLVVGFDVLDLLHTVTLRCVELLELSAGGMLLADQRGGLRVVAVSSEQPRLIALLQAQNEEGPSLDCVRTGQPTGCADLGDGGEQWPSFVPAVREAGYAAAYALPMRLNGTVIGALNLFDERPRTLESDQLTLGQALADVATVGIMHEQAFLRNEAVTEQLQATLNARIVLEQAKGVVAERLRLPMDEALAALRGRAEVSGRGLQDFAEFVVLNGGAEGLS